jgi:hypothetical protein
MAVTWSRLIDAGMGRRFHALPASADPGAVPPVAGLLAIGPTVQAGAACGWDNGTFRRGGHVHEALAHCIGCCRATGVAAGFGAPDAAVS